MVKKRTSIKNSMRSLKRLIAKVIDLERIKRIEREREGAHDAVPPQRLAPTGTKPAGLNSALTFADPSLSLPIPARGGIRQADEARKVSRGPREEEVGRAED